MNPLILQELVKRLMASSQLSGGPAPMRDAPVGASQAAPGMFMEPNGDAAIARGAIADEQIGNDLFRAAQDAERSANTPDELPVRHTGITKHKIGPLLIGQLLSTLLLKDREGQFAKGAMGVISAQEEEKFQNQVAKLKQKKDERLLAAKQAYDSSHRYDQQLGDKRKREQDEKIQKALTERATIGANAKIAGYEYKTDQELYDIIREGDENKAVVAARELMARGKASFTPEDIAKLGQVGRLDLSKINLNNQQAIRAAEQAKTEAYRRDHYKSLGLMNDAKAAELARQTYWMDLEKATSIAKANAEMDKIESDIGKVDKELAYKYWDANQSRLAAANETVASAARTIKEEQNGLRTLIGQYEKLLAEERSYEDGDKAAIANYESKIRQAKERLGHLNKTFDDLTKQVKGIRSSFGLSGNDVSSQGLGSSKGNMWQRLKRPFEGGGGPNTPDAQTFSAALDQMIADSGGKLKVVSRTRTRADQERLYKKYGPRRAAKPGSSPHEFGIAADLDGDLAWAHQNAHKYGLYFPLLNGSKTMMKEPWHIQLRK